MAIYRCSDKTCPVSGRDLDESVKFCAKCGSKVKLVKAASSANKKKD